MVLTGKSIVACRRRGSKVWIVQSHSLKFKKEALASRPRPINTQSIAASKLDHAQKSRSLQTVKIVCKIRGMKKEAWFNVTGRTVFTDESPL